MIFQFPQTGTVSRVFVAEYEDISSIPYTLPAVDNNRIRILVI